MITYKIYQYSNFEEIHSDLFQSLLEGINKYNLLSPNIEEIIITDDIEGEIDRQCKTRNSKSRLTKSREFKAIAKTIDFDGKKKVFLDAIHLNLFSEHTTQIFNKQLIEIYAEDIVAGNYEVPQTYTFETPLTEIIKLHFSQWATKTIARTFENKFTYGKQLLYSDIKIFADSFKRNVRKLHYKHQEDLDLGIFWFNMINELDNFIRRCLDVKSDEGSFLHLQEFSEHIPLLLEEIDIQTNHLLANKHIEFNLIRIHFLEILRLCFINIPSEQPMTVKIIDTPKRLFKGNLVDTEPRIVAFMRIPLKADAHSGN